MEVRPRSTPQPGMFAMEPVGGGEDCPRERTRSARGERSGLGAAEDSRRGPAGAGAGGRGAQRLEYMIFPRSYGQAPTRRRQKPHLRFPHPSPMSK